LRARVKPLIRAEDRLHIDRNPVTLTARCNLDGARTLAARLQTEMPDVSVTCVQPDAARSGVPQGANEAL
jgi:hypothetical protein